MLLEIALAFLLLGFCVIIHAGGMILLLKRLVTKSRQAWRHRFGPMIQLVEVAGWLLVLHLAEIALWGVAYWGLGCLPSLEPALYFSGVTYATVGYGDVVLPREWRMFAPIEGLTGILMCGLSTSFFFIVVSRLMERLRHAGGGG